MLALGDGDGRALAALLRANSGAAIDYVDLIPDMVELARARSRRVAYQCADALTMPLTEGGYDLIVTHFFLDCFEERGIERLLERVASAARPDARWVISEFRKPGLLVGMLYLFFRITTGLRTRRLVDNHPLLGRCGFCLLRSEWAFFGQLSAELWTHPGATPPADESV